MIPNWLNPKRSKANSLDFSNIKHQILQDNIGTIPTSNEDEVYFGCGCFWGAEKGFWKLPGVKTTAVGYAGGESDNPNYNEVCTGQTGHAEVVRVVWNTTLIDISDLLKMFWECHDPTQGNRQGNDCGSQYRSAIFSKNNYILNIASNSKDEYQSLLRKNGYGSITTEIGSDFKFFYAEEYHQQYLAKPGSRPYCSAMPTNISLSNFKGSNFKLMPSIWENFNWEESHCVLRSNNSPIKN